MSHPEVKTPTRDLDSFSLLRRFATPGVADLIFLFVALVVVWGATHDLLDDPGLGWHLRNIDAMIDAGGWLTLDPFTDHHGQPPPRWYTNQWLGDLPLWLGWRLAGLEGIAVVAGIIIGLIGAVSM